MDSQLVEWGEFSLSVLALVSLVKNVFFTFAMFIYLVNVWGGNSLLKRCGLFVSGPV